jgi:ring-1,2-phenylacetyl-CoA epoxidase subunit PaaE
MVTFFPEKKVNVSHILWATNPKWSLKIRNTNNRSYSLFLWLMSRYHPLRIAKIQPETTESVSVWLEVPEDLKEAFRYKSGQYLNCRAIIDGEEIRKSYSICSVPGDTYLVIAVKLVHGGKMSTYINKHLKTGDTFEVTPPEGKFVLPDLIPEDALLVFFAAGSGITPVMSLIRFYLTHHPKGQVVLFYSNKSSDSIIFREQLEALKNEHMQRFSVYYILTREVTGVDLLSGRIDQEKCRVFGKHFFDPSEVYMAFICGPELMIMDVKAGLQNMGIPEEHIRFELFGTGAFYTKRTETASTDFTDIAMRSGLDIPYSCKGGVCSTCRALVVEGSVHMDIHYGLEPDEIDAGYVLTCQSHPRTERVILDYDIL